MPLFSAAAPNTKSLSDVNGTISVQAGRSIWRRLFAFAGPGFMVAVGYMDPGNWATSIAGGSAFGYSLLCVILLSNFIAIFLQALALRLGVVTGHDLAQACRQYFGRKAGIFLWVLCEIAICATDLAEVIGTAIALNLLFKIPLTVGVVITILDVFLLLLLQRWGFRKLEAFVVALLLIIGACYGYNLLLAQPVWGDVLNGFIPSSDVVTNSGMLYLAIGILGATVMPHNLYLHSAIVQTRAIGKTDADKRDAIRFATIDSTVALMFALLVNSAILILAASVFHTSGHSNIAEIQDAYHLLDPLLGSHYAALCFGIALLACGLNSTATATLAGQIVMEGFLDIRLPPWLRRLVTRLLAVIPALIAAFYYGDSGTAKLLIASQVILSLQLPFAIIPLLLFVGSTTRMGPFAIARPAQIIGWIIALAIIALNLVMLRNIFYDA